MVELSADHAHEHIHDIAYDRAECLACGEQEAYCRTCGAVLCGCAYQKEEAQGPGPVVRREIPVPTSHSLARAGDGQSILDALVHSPAHYTAYAVEVIEITETLNFCRGNVVKYVLRAGLKNPDTEVQDLEKARWYLDREIARMKKKQQHG